LHIQQIILLAYNFNTKMRKLQGLFPEEGCIQMILVNLGLTNYDSEA